MTEDRPMYDEVAASIDMTVVAQPDAVGTDGEDKAQSSMNGVDHIPVGNTTTREDGDDEPEVEFPVENMTVTYHDEPNEITRGRRLARYLSSKYDWYDPQARQSILAVSFVCLRKKLC